MTSIMHRSVSLLMAVVSPSLAAAFSATIIPVGTRSFCLTQSLAPRLRTFARLPLRGGGSNGPNFGGGFQQSLTMAVGISDVLHFRVQDSSHSRVWQGMQARPLSNLRLVIPSTSSIPHRLCRRRNSPLCAVTVKSTFDPFLSIQL